MSLSKLPCDLIYTISDIMPLSSLNSLLRTCRSLHQLLGPELITRITRENLASSILTQGIALRSLPVVRFALAHNAEWHTFDDDEQCHSAFEAACESNQLDIVTALLTHFGPAIHKSHIEDSETKVSRFCHPRQLELAIRRTNVPLITLLLEHGAPANRTVWYEYPRRHKSPIDIAGKYGTPEIVEVLIKHGACVDDTNALHYALRRERWDIVEVLLLNGLPVWKYPYPWGRRCRVDGGTPEEFKWWVDCAIAYTNQKKEERLASMAGIRERLFEEAAAASEEAETGSEEAVPGSEV